VDEMAIKHDSTIEVSCTWCGYTVKRTKTNLHAVGEELRKMGWLVGYTRQKCKACQNKNK